MKRWSPVATGPTLCLLAALGCEDPASVTVVGKPPAGGAPREIVFVETGARIRGDGILAMAADGSNVGTITVESTLASDPSWSPTGTAIAYRALNAGIYTVNADGSNKVLLMSESQCGGSCGYPVWSPLGHEIAVVNTTTSAPVLFVVPAAGGPAQVLYTEPANAGGFGSLAWNADGTRLAMDVNRPSAGSEVLVIERATGVATSVLTLAGIQFLDWGRQGSNQLVFNVVYGTDPIRFDIYLVDDIFSSPTPHLLTPEGRHPSFSPNNAFIVYEEMATKGGSTNLTGIMTLELATGVKVKLRGDGRSADWKR